MLKLIALEEINKNYDAMVAYMERGLKAHPGSAYLKVLMARYHILQGKPEQVPVALGDMDVNQRNLPDVINVLGLSQLERGQFFEAKNSFEKLSKSRPDAPQARFHLGKAYLGLNDKAKAMKEFRAAFEISPGYLAPRIELTKLLFEQKNKKEVQDQLSLLKEIAPDYYEVLQLEGEIPPRWETGKSIGTFALAHEKMPSTRNMLILARQMLSMGDRQASRQLQESWVEEHPQDSLARLELARLYITDNEEKLAQEQYSAVLAIDKQNLLALNNLAGLLRETDTKRALEYAEEAVRLEPKSAAALDTLAVVQSKTGNHLKAQRSIERALEIFPRDPSLLYHSAMITAEAGNEAKAKQQLQALLAEKAEFPEKEEAAALLKTLK
ncbi:MAG: tetratricopeptide repeat protein [Porticoccaceae bacterium]